MGLPTLTEPPGPLRQSPALRSMQDALEKNGPVGPAFFALAFKMPHCDCPVLVTASEGTRVPQRSALLCLPPSITQVLNATARHVFAGAF